MRNPGFVKSAGDNMENANWKNLWAILFFAAFLAVSFAAVRAEASNTIPLAPTQASVDFKEPEIVVKISGDLEYNQGTHEISIPVTLSNNAGKYFYGLHYAVEIYKGDRLQEQGDLFSGTEYYGGGMFPVTKGYDSLGPGDVLNFRLPFKPDYAIKSGNYFIKFMIMTEYGQVYSMDFTSKPIALEGIDDSFGFLKCFLQAGDDLYLPSQGEPIGPETSPSVILSLGNDSKMAERVRNGNYYAYTEVFLREITGELVRREPKIKADISERKETSIKNIEGYKVNPGFVIEGRLQPGLPSETYRTRTVLLDGDGEEVSIPCYLRWVIKGPAGRINNVITARNEYKKGEMFDLQLELTGPPDKSQLDVMVNINLFDKNNRKIDGITKKITTGTEKTFFNFTEKVFSRNMAISRINISMIDYQSRKELDSKEFFYKPKAEEKKGMMEFINAGRLLTAIIIVLVIIILAYLILRKRKMPILLIVLVAALLPLPVNAACTASVWYSQASLYCNDLRGVYVVAITASDANCINGFTGWLYMYYNGGLVANVYLPDPGHVTSTTWGPYAITNWATSTATFSSYYGLSGCISSGCCSREGSDWRQIRCCYPPGTGCSENAQCCSSVCNVRCCSAACPADGWYCNGNTREYRDYYCSAAGGCEYTPSSQTNCAAGSGCYCVGTTWQNINSFCSSGSCGSSVLSSQDCAAVASADSDGGASYQAGGVVTDYNGCAGGCTCTSSQYSDYCIGNSVYEYWASGNSYAGSLYSCESYEGSVYCSGNSLYRSEWGCSGSPGYCNDAAAADSAQEDCSMKASTDSDGGATYQSGGTVTDYTGCIGSSCTGNTYSDYCSGTSVYEYWASGNSYTGSLYNCENYESYFCSGNDRYHKEWGCSGSPGYCNDAAVPDSFIENCASYSGCLGDDYRTFACSIGSCTPTIDSCTDCSCSCGGYNAVETNANSNCADGKDNDCDGLTDFNDPGCCQADGTSCTQGSQCCSANCVIEGVGNDICCGAGNTCVDSGNVCRVKTIENTLALCTDNIDNDCNGFADSSDTSCYGTVSGTAKNTQGNPLNNAKVEVYRSGAKVGEGYTLADGSYSISVPAGTLNLAVILTDYVSGTVEGVVMPALGNAIANFNMTYGKVCEDDCTYLIDDACHASCNGQNGCSFYDQAAANACDLAKAGWSVSYDMSKVISCCEGQPEDKSEIKAYVNCGLSNLVKYYSIVNYNGKPIKMVTVVCTN